MNLISGYILEGRLLKSYTRVIYILPNYVKSFSKSCFFSNFQVSYFDILVPTVDTVRFGYLMDKLLAGKRSVLFTGTTGVGKVMYCVFLTKFQHEESYKKVITIKVMLVFLKIEIPCE